MDIKKFIPDIGNSTTAYNYEETKYGEWEISSQTVLENKYIYNRTFSYPTEKEYETFILETDKFYLVKTKFEVETFQSSGKFFRWNYDIDEYVIEYKYKNEISSTFKWERTNELGLVTLVLDVGKALGIRIKNESSNDSYIHKVAFKGKKSPLYHNHLLEIKTQQNEIEVLLYGEDRDSYSVYPSHLGKEYETLFHNEKTKWKDRLFPPGRKFNDNFWNDPTKEDPELNDWNNRGESKWLVISAERYTTIEEAQ